MKLLDIKFNKLKPLIIAFFLSILLIIFYLNFLSQNWAGDGVRHIETISGMAFPKVSSFRWFLFPIIGWSFYHFILSLGYKISVILAIQIMNAVMAGLIIGFYYWFIYLASKNNFVAICSALSFAFTACFVMHATDITEPITGIFVLCIALSILISGIKRKSIFLLFGAGFIISVATAIYQAMILSVPAILFIIWLFWKEKFNNNKFSLKRWHCLLYFIMGFILVQIPIFWFYKFLHGLHFMEALRESSHPCTVGLWGNFDNLKKLYYLFLGLSLNLVRTVTYWYGVGTLLAKGRWFDIVSVLFFVFLVGTVSLVAILHFIKNRRRLDTQSKKYIAIAAVWYFVPAIFSQWFYAGYDKLWIQPIMAYIFFLSLFISDLLKSSGNRYAIKGTVVGAVLLIMLCNLFYVILPKHYKKNIPYLESIRMSKFISEKDLVISTSWDALPTYLKYFTQVKVFFLANIDLTALKNGQDNLQIVLNKAIKDTLESGGRVYFLGMFEYEDTFFKFKFKKERLEDYYKNSQFIELVPINEEGNIRKELRIYQGGYHSS